ncbi:MAG: hypothetical protein SGCHY_000038 [Lobulomycetales sp.]
MAGALRSSPGGLAAFKTAGSKSKISKVTEHLAIQRRQSDIKNETNRQKPQSDGGMKSPSGRSSRDSSLESTPIKMIEIAARNRTTPSDVKASFRSRSSTKDSNVAPERRRSPRLQNINPKATLGTPEYRKLIQRRRVQAQLERLEDDYIDQYSSSSSSDGSESLSENEDLFQEEEEPAKSSTPRSSGESLPKLSVAELMSTLALVPTMHADLIQDQLSLYERNFEPFVHHLDHGFNVLLHGYGSKIPVISAFVKYLTELGETVVEVNGFSPSISIKQIVGDICHDIIGLESRNFEAQIQCILEWSKSNKIYLAIHNIDGPMLSKVKAQDTIARLASAGVGLIASIDHQNAYAITSPYTQSALAWDLSKVKKLNFIAHDVTTFLDYKIETSFERSLLVTKFCGEGNQIDSIEGVQYVLTSLTENSRRVFKELLLFQIAEMNEEMGSRKTVSPGDCGMKYDSLYYRCVEKFYVTSRNVFDSILVEFRDHDLIKEEKGNLFVPLKVSTLEDILENSL